MKACGTTVSLLSRSMRPIHTIHRKSTQSTLWEGGYRNAVCCAICDASIAAHVRPRSQEEARERYGRATNVTRCYVQARRGLTLFYSGLCILVQYGGLRRGCRETKQCLE